MWEKDFSQNRESNGTTEYREDVFRPQPPFEAPEQNLPDSESDSYGANDINNEEVASGHMFSPKKRRSYLKWGSIVLVILVALFVLPIPLGKIEIEGTKKITETDVIAAGGMGYPVNILQVSTSKLEHNLKHDLRIEEAKVNYAFPLTLKVAITERRAVGIAVSQFGYIELDKTGQVIQLGPAISNTTAPILSGFKLGNVLLGDQIEEGGVLNALTYLNALSENGAKGISEVNVGDSNMMLAYTVDGLPIHIGDTSNLAEKAKLTEDMLQDVKLHKINAQYIDVNIKSPYIKVNQ